MALFDRRLLAYFDDGLGTGGSMTLLDRITDYQRDLAEIERELSKYQVLLGNRQVQYRHRDRDGWIAKNREQKTIKERYRRVAQAMSGEGDHVGRERPDVQPVADGLEIVEQSQRRISTTSAARKNPRGSTRGSVQTSPAAPGKSLTVWVQIDTVSGLPASRSAAYMVRASWMACRHYQAETEERPGERDNGDEKCVVRQQLKLEGHPGSHMVRVSIHRREDGPLTQVGECNVDANDDYNLELQYHALSDARGPLFCSRADDAGRPVPSTVRLRLTHANASAQPQPALKSASRGSIRRNSQSGSDTRPKEQQSAASAKRTSTEDISQRRRNSGARDSVAPPPREAVTQDPVVPQRRLSASGASGAAGATAAAALAAPAAVAVSEAPSIDVSPSRSDAPLAETPVSPRISHAPTDGSAFDQEIEGEEEEEEMESSDGMMEELFEEGEEEEREGDSVEG